MTTYLLLAVSLVSAADSEKDTPRQPHPLAPSLLQATKEETAKYEAIVERFVRWDTGKLPKSAGAKILEEFKGLPPAAFFVLLEGFNEAANREDACPAVIIGKKILNILNASDDLELLALARENLGAGVKSKRHQGLLRDMQFAILTRKGYVQRKLAAAGVAGGEKLPPTMSLLDLAKIVENGKGPRVKAALVEIEKRPGDKVFELLAIAASSPDEDIQKLGVSLLGKNLARQTPAKLRELLKHDRPEVKVAAAKEVGTRKLRYGAELIALLSDGEPSVQQAGRAALIQLSGSSVDHGPRPDDSVGERETAVRRWREWWGKQ